ncbi:MAG TPA: gamma-glutamyltransferase [Vicinamibacterales bacterium]|nr:gamma-glutamyltransferase [Vicinamibacterales bacterium]
MTRRAFLVLATVVISSLALQAGNAPIRAKQGLVITQSGIASEIGFQVIRDGGNAVDAAVATALAMAVTHPTAGNIGGGGFIVYRSAAGEATTFDFREMAPAGSNPEMWLVNGKYDSQLHHNSHRAVGVPGTVAGLHLAWKTYGSKPWKDLVEPSVKLARDGFEMSDGLARSLARMVETAFTKYPASLAQFSKNGTPYEAGELFKQPDLARSLQRIADHGPAGFYEGETAALIEKEMKANGGLITREDLKNYQAKQRAPIKGTYRGYEIIGMPPPSSGGISVQLILNILEGYDLKANGAGSAQNLHLMAESMRRAFAERAQHLADPDFVKTMPVDRLISKDYAAQLRKTINPSQASKSSPTTFTFTTESPETTHISIVDAQRNAVSLTYTLEAGYGSKIVVPGGGFLLNNEMGDFNAGPGLTNENGLIGTDPNLAQPGKRMLSSMSPTIIAKDGKLFMVTGTPGGRTIINTVLQTILNVIDFGMNAQEAVDYGRMHHQWLPDRISYEEHGFSPDTIAILKKMGHTVQPGGNQGADQVIVVNPEDGWLEGGLDRRPPDGGAAGK